MATVTRSNERSPALLHDIDWRTYSLLLRAFAQAGQRRRLTYDRGKLEIMSPLWEHENPAYLLGRFVDVLCEEFDLPMRAGRSVTLRRRRQRRGLEPDNCYWIASAPRLQGKTRLDLRVDPPPDLAIEVDVTSSSLDRMGIYAALGVPEVWRLSEQGLAFHRRGAEKYETNLKSLTFPALASADLLPFLEQPGKLDDTALVKQFRAWARQDLLKRP